MIAISIALLFCTLYAVSEDGFEHNDKKAINQYIESQGYSNPIVLDSSNIKQYWIDNSVLSKDNNINILLQHSPTTVFASVPQPIKLVNIHEAMNCTIDIIAETPDISFSVKNENEKVIAKSSANKDFTTYKVFSATVHLEDLQNDTLFLEFHSAASEYISIKNVVFSFSINKNGQYLLSPGLFEFSKNNVNAFKAHTVDEQDFFTLEGIDLHVTSQKKFLVTDNILKFTGKVKNIGDISTSIAIGVFLYFKNGDSIRVQNYPYLESSGVLKVVSSQEGSNEIVVDSYQRWTKGCHIALNADENMQDVPNADLLEGTMDDFIKLSNGNAKMVLNKPLKKALASGEKLRIHGTSSGGIYPYRKELSPGEEISFDFVIRKDNNRLKYSQEAIPKGVYYVVPVLFAASTDSNIESIISIHEFTISY